MFKELNREFLTGFHAYIAKEAGYKKNTIWIYMIALKHILMLARSKGYMDKDIFANYKLQSEFVTRNYLTMDEINRMMQYENEDVTLQLVRDTFLFSCFTGLSYVDIRGLEPQNIQEINKQLWINTTRRKTGSEVNVRLFTVPYNILLKYMPASGSGRIFELPSNGWCNKCLDKIVAEVGKPKHEYTSCAVPAELFEEIKKIVTPEEMEEAVFTDDKQTREENIRVITEKLEEAFADNEEWLAILGEAVYQYQKKTVRKMILKDHKRPDGRDIKQIRPLHAEVDCLPRVHGSALFQRGQTQVMTVTTLGSLSEAQRLDGIDVTETTKRYMHHYNFPSYSVGETRPSRGPGRREIGHGALAERALVPVLPSEEEFPYAIRTVSEIMESNGSTSQGSICASSLSLMAAGVPVKAPVAGISVGLVTGEGDDDYIILTDIQGLEDFFGDMDFKVAGTDKGITAIQMDIKIHGLTEQIIREAIARTKEARTHILHDVMNPVIPAARDHVGEFAPKISQYTIDPEKISEVIGKQGKTINGIIDETGVKIDIDESGRIDILSEDQAMIDKAISIIKSIVEPLNVGDIYEGEVVRIMNFGAFVQLSPNKDGMIHISKLSNERVEKVEDVVNIGDKVAVKVLEIDKMGRINLKLEEKIED